MATVTPAPLQLQSAAAAVHACAGDAAVMEKLLAVTAAAEVTSVKITAMSLFIIFVVLLVSFDSAVLYSLLSLTSSISLHF